MYQQKLPFFNKFISKNVFYKYIVIQHIVFYISVLVTVDFLFFFDHAITLFNCTFFIMQIRTLLFKKMLSQNTTSTSGGVFYLGLFKV